MDYKDYYKALGLERTATQDEIKRTYRKLARKFHPDINKNAGAEDKFKDVGEAYAVIGDVEKRAAYDQLGRNWQPGQDFQPPPNWDAGFEFSGSPKGAGHGSEGTSDFFEALFGRMGGRERGNRQRPEFHARGEDHHAKILIDVADAFAGATRTIQLRMPDVDDDGHVRLRDRTLAVKIPKGVIEGQNIRLKGQGAAGLGAEAGDLYLEIQFKPDAVYRVAGHDLYVDLPLAPWEAALGAEIETPTPLGPIRLKVPPNSAQGRQLRIKGRGIPAAQAGDLYAVLKIVLPPADTDKARKVYADMARDLAFDPRAPISAKQGV